MIKKTYLLIILISIVIADKTLVSSFIVDIYNKPIQDANIYTDQNGTSSDKTGYFSFECDKSDIITITHIAYQSISLFAEDIPDTVKMSRRTVHSDQIIIEGVNLDTIYKSSIGISIVKDTESSQYQHFDDIINKLPSLSFSGGTSRARYFQIRGIGELSQFAGEGPPNFYVGYNVDGIDFSGMGMGLISDIEQIEVFKGPFSVLYGINSLAGNINIASKDPTPFKTGLVSVSLLTDNGYSLTGHYSNKIIENFYHRIAYKYNKSNGFVNNTYHNIEDSNKINESMLRYKLLFIPKESLKIKFTAYSIDIINGYDQWSPDNNSFITYSNFLGEDTQKTNAFSLKTNLDINNVKITSTISGLFSSIKYSYDGDWGNDSYWSDNYDWSIDSETFDFTNDKYFPWGYYNYDFIDITNRKRQGLNADINVIKKYSSYSLIFGASQSFTKELDQRKGWLFGGQGDSLYSDYTISNTSFYTGINKNIRKFTLKLSARYDYIVQDNISFISYYSSEVSSNQHNTSVSLLGSRAELLYDISSNLNLMSSVSRGYKPSGINQTPNIGIDDGLPESLRTYDAEQGNNFDLNLRFEDEKTYINLGIFYMYRVKPQIRLSYKLIEGDPTSFDYYTTNADRGYTYGIEGDMRFSINDNLLFYDRFTINKTYHSKYSYLDTEIGDRSMSHAPEFCAYGGIEYLYKNFKFKADHSVNLGYYYDDQSIFKSDPYQLLNIEAEININNLIVSVFSKNVMDERYTTRGYYFSLEPSPIDNGGVEFQEKLYTSFGSPRQFGLTISYKY